MKYYTVRGLSSSNFKTYRDALSAANGDISKVMFPEVEDVLETLPEPKKKVKSKSINQQSI